MLVQRYLLRIIARRWAVALLLLGAVYLAFDLGDQGRRLAAVLGWRTVLGATLLHVPLIAAQLLPVALLLGGALAVATLRRGGELEALAGAGLTPLCLGLPLVLLGLLGALLGLLLVDRIAPALEARADELYDHRRSSALTGELPTGRWYRQTDGDGGQLFVARSGTQATLLRVDRSFAARQRIEGRLAGLALRDAWIYTLRAPVARTQRQRLATPELAALSSLWRETRGRPEALDGAALRARLRTARAAGRGARVDELLLESRRAFPALALVVAIVLWGFALAPARSSPRQLALAISWVGLFWATLAAGWLLARSGALAPALGAWGPLGACSALALGSLARGWPRARRVC